MGKSFLTNIKFYFFGLKVGAIDLKLNFESIALYEIKKKSKISKKILRKNTGYLFRGFKIFLLVFYQKNHTGYLLNNRYIVKNCFFLKKLPEGKIKGGKKNKPIFVILKF